MEISHSNILGIRISNIFSYSEVYDKIKLSLKLSSSYVTVNNVHTVIEGVLNNRYKEVINNSILALPDGKPLSIVGQLKGNGHISRIFGPTFFEKTIYWGQKDGIKHYFFGSTQETLKSMISIIKIKYPETIISGSHAPPFKKFTQKENEEFITNINASNADLIWIGLGAPKQEIWMYENYSKLKHGIMIGIGAGFDYLAGNTKHAPEWMKNLALEWFYRLIQEPRRLWKRYLVTNTLFIWYVFLEFAGLRKFD